MIVWRIVNATRQQKRSAGPFAETTNGFSDGTFACIVRLTSVVCDQVLVFLSQKNCFRVQRQLRM